MVVARDGKEDMHRVVVRCGLSVGPMRGDQGAHCNRRHDEDDPQPSNKGFCTKLMHSVLLIDHIQGSHSVSIN
jgi:hypothetical protein